MTLTGENRSTGRETCPSGALSILNLTWTDLRTNPGLRNDKPVTVRAMTWLLKPYVQINNIINFVSYLTENTASSLQRPVSTLDSDSKAVSCTNRIKHCFVRMWSFIVAEGSIVGIILGYEPAVRGHLGVREFWPQNLRY